MAQGQKSIELIGLGVRRPLDSILLSRRRYAPDPALIVEDDYVEPEIEAIFDTARIHGNGFLQLDLPNGMRLHLWDDRLPRQSVNTAIHNHRFGFAVYVVKGTMINTALHLYNMERERASHQLYMIDRHKDTEDTKLIATNEFVRPRVNRSFIVHEGSHYAFPFGAFHVSQPLGTTITLMRKLAISDNVEVRVACRINEEPDNNFNRDTAEIPQWVWDELYPYVSEYVMGAGINE